MCVCEAYLDYCYGDEIVVEEVKTAQYILGSIENIIQNIVTAFQKCVAKVKAMRKDIKVPLNVMDAYFGCLDACTDVVYDYVSGSAAKILQPGYSTTILDHLKKIEESNDYKVLFNSDGKKSNKWVECDVKKVLKIINNNLDLINRIKKVLNFAKRDSKDQSELLRNSHAILKIANISLKASNLILSYKQTEVSNESFIDIDYDYDPDLDISIMEADIIMESFQPMVAIKNTLIRIIGLLQRVYNRIRMLKKFYVPRDVLTALSKFESKYLYKIGEIFSHFKNNLKSGDKNIMNNLNRSESIKSFIDEAYESEEYKIITDHSKEYSKEDYEEYTAKYLLKLLNVVIKGMTEAKVGLNKLSSTSGEFDLKTSYRIMIMCGQIILKSSNSFLSFHKPLKDPKTKDAEDEFHGRVNV